MKRSIFVMTLIFLFCASAVVLAQSGGGYDLTWWTVDGGGGTLSGGGYALGGTIGQPEPGPVLTGGSFALYSGFWAGGGAAPPSCPNPITGGWIVGPDSGYTGVNYDFTAGPDAAATSPFTYTWSSDGLVSGQGTANATYSWAVAGTYILSATIANCGGSVDITHTITLAEPPPTCAVPLTEVGLSGPTAGQTGQDLTFTASYTPANATVPITYTWSSDGLVSGQGTNTAVYRWTNAGQYQVTVSAQNCGGSDNASQNVTITAPSTCAIPLTGVSLSGPASGQTGQDLTFTVSPQPTDASTPITYTWSTDGLVSGQGTTQATYRWAGAGSKTVQVTARNCGGQDYSDSRTVSITAACAVPLVGVSITGQTDGYVNVTYQFTALPDPSNATAPVSYVWSSDGLQSGQGTAQASYTWAITGSHTISVTATNCGGSFSDDHTIMLTTPPSGCNFPLTGFTISGPTTGQTGQNLTFTGHITPTNATTPITYTWSSDGLVSGQGSNTAVYNWTTPGQYQIVASAANCGGAVNDSHPIVIASEYRVYLPLVVR
ncbi:MAG TPA: PKD domain-containing protein [Anaerolineae bacterium]|nr:PKD domain-containing protein [Anaerolineae bacterium]